MLVLALLGLMMTVTITSVNAIYRSAGEKDAEASTFEAIAQVRRAAVTSGNMIVLQATEDALMWEGGRVDLAGSNLQVRLLPPERESAVLIGGRLKEEALAEVKFYPDGTCDAFRVEVSRGGARRTVAIDPWTCASLPKPSGSSR